MARQRDREHYLDMMRRNPGAMVGFTLAASGIYAARYGVCEAKHHGTPEWKALAREVKHKHGEDIAASDVAQMIVAAYWAARVQRIVDHLDGNMSEAARRLRVKWETARAWAHGRLPRNANDRARIEEVERELRL